MFNNQSKMLAGLVGTMIDQAPYYTPFISITRFHETRNPEEVPYMGIKWSGSNLDIQFNEAGMMSLPPRHRIGVLKHELAHYYLGHLTGRRMKAIEDAVTNRFTEAGKADVKRISNIVMDLEINSMLGKDDLPECGCFPDKMGLPEGLLAEEYVRLLPEPPKMEGKFDGKDVDPDGDGEPMDDLQEEDMKSRIKEARGRGSMPAELERLLAKLNPPQVQWRSMFKKDLLSQLRSRNTIPTFSRPHRRGLPIAGRMYKQKPDIYVLQDTSGSVSPEELGMLSSELFGMRRHANRIRVVVCDAAVHSVYDFKGRIESVAGGGGSDYEPAIEFVRQDHRGYRKPIIILLTDGDIYVPDEADMPGSVIWVLCQGDRNVPYGRKIVLDRPSA